MYWLMVLESGKAKMKEPASDDCLTVSSCSGKMKRGREVYKSTQTHIISRLDYNVHNQPKLVAATCLLFPHSCMPH